MNKLFKLFHGGLDMDAAEPSSVRTFKTIVYGLIIALFVGAFFILNKFDILKPGATTSQKVRVTGAKSASLANPNFASARPDYIMPSEIQMMGKTPKYAAVPAGTVQIKVWGFPWLAQAPLAGYMGGKATSVGSIAERDKVYVEFWPHEDTNEILGRFITSAEKASEGDYNSISCNVTYVMANYGPKWVELINSRLKPLREVSQKQFGNDGGFTAVGFHPLGKSFNEDCIWGFEPELKPGAIVAAVPLDGDEDILFRYCDFKSYEINTNPGIYMYHAVNVRPVNTFREAGEVLMHQVKGDIQKIYDKNGRYTGRDTTAAPNAMTSWTPVDRNVYEWFKKKGRAIYRYTGTEEFDVMPCMGFTLNRYLDEQYSETFIGGQLEKMMEGCYIVADQVIFHEERSMKYIGQACAFMFGEQTPQYWAEMYRGIKVPLKNGKIAQLGGSRVLSIHDACFNLNIMDEKGTITSEPDLAHSAYGVIYTTNAQMMTQLHPKDLRAENVVTLEQAFNTTLLASVAYKLKGQIQKIERPKFAATEESSLRKVATSQWYFNFASGSSYLEQTERNESEIERLTKMLSTTPGLYIKIAGFTDSDGDATQNEILSMQRANHIRDRVLQAGYRINAEQLKFVEGYGEQPEYFLQTNDTVAGKARNRRVEITVLSQ